MGSLAECEYACLLFPTYSYTLICIIRQRMLLLDCIMILDHITGFLIENTGSYSSEKQVLFWMFTITVFKVTQL